MVDTHATRLRPGAPTTVNATPRLQRSRTSGISSILFVLAALCMLTCMVGFVFLTLPSTRSFQAELQRQAEDDGYHEFLIPGTTETKLEAGMVFVVYLTDHEFEGSRYQVPDSLLFNLEVTNSAGEVIPFGEDPSHTTNLPTDDGEDAQLAVLIGIVEIPKDDTYTFNLTTNTQSANRAVGRLITLTQTQKDEISRIMVYLGLIVCGGGGAVFLGMLGAGAVWMDRQSRRLSEAASMPTEPRSDTA